MTMKQSFNPYGYKDLLAYKKAEELQKACAAFTALFSHSPHFTLRSLQDQMDRSARSIKQNIVEGWKRNSTKEYHQFLGFSLGANAELEEDCDDIIKGVYETGGRGLKREEWGEGEKWDIEQVQKLPFYPLNSRLPLLVQLKLRCKEMNFLLTKLQQSLEKKMQEGDGVLKGAWGTGERGKKGNEWLEKEIEARGFARLPDGQLVPKKNI